MIVFETELHRDEMSAGGGRLWPSAALRPKISWVKSCSDVGYLLSHPSVGWVGRLSQAPGEEVEDDPDPAAGLQLAVGDQPDRELQGR